MSSLGSAGASDQDAGLGQSALDREKANFAKLVNDAVLSGSITESDLSEKFGIPLFAVRHWRAGISMPRTNARMRIVEELKQLQ